MSFVGVVTIVALGIAVFLGYLGAYYVTPVFTNPGVIEACHALDYTLDTTSSIFYTCYEEFEDGSIRKITYKKIDGEFREIRN